MQLGDEAHGGEGVDAPKAPQSADDTGVPRIEARLLDLGVEGAKPLFDVLEGEQVVLEDPPVFPVLEAQAAQPEPMSLAPRLLSPVPSPAVTQ